MRLARDAVKTNRCVVIGLQSTGEARTLEQLERDDGELSDFVSTAKGVFSCLVSHFLVALDIPILVQNPAWLGYSLMKFPASIVRDLLGVCFVR